MKKADRAKEQALLVLVTTPNYTEAAKVLGISPPTIYEWLKDPVFSQELNRRRNQLVEESLDRLKNYVNKSAETLGALLDDANPQIRRGAANDILNHVMKFKEVIEIEQRLNAIERKISHDYFED